MPNIILYVFAPGKTDEKGGDTDYTRGSLELIQRNAPASEVFSLFPKEANIYGYAVEKEANKPAGPKKDLLVEEMWKLLAPPWNNEFDAHKLRDFFKKGTGSFAVMFEVEIEVDEIKDETTKTEKLEKIYFTKEQIINIKWAYGAINNTHPCRYNLKVPQEYLAKYEAAYNKAQVVKSDEKQPDTDKQMLKGFIAMCELYLNGGTLKKAFAHAEKVRDLRTVLQAAFDSDTPDFGMILDKVKGFQKTIIQDILAKKGTLTSKGKKENSAALAEIMLDKLSARLAQKQVEAALPKAPVAAVTNKSDIAAAIGTSAQYQAVVGGKPTNAQAINAKEAWHRDYLAAFGLADPMPTAKVPAPN